MPSVAPPVSGTDRAAAIQAAVGAAFAAGQPLAIVGGGSKPFIGRRTASLPLAPLEVGEHAGIVSYEPSELVVTARAGTRLDVLEAALAEAGQHLAFEPPHYGAGATVGGTLACGLSGPRRPYAGAVRDFVLGIRIVNGRGDDLRFGGQVMKNVAGYDVSRLMAGALGTLGVILEVSLKVLPRPAEETTLAFDDAALPAALERMHAWAARPLPLSATCHDGERLYVRLSGTAAGVAAARAALGGAGLDGGRAFWEALREHRLAFFDGDAPLWRLAVPATAPPLGLGGEGLVEWGGALRWLRSHAPAAVIRAAAGEAGGHATLYRGGDRTGEVFHPLADGVARLHARLKAAFDPRGILNPGRMYPDL